MGYNSVGYDLEEYRFETDDKSLLNRIIDKMYNKLESEVDISDVAFENDIDVEDFENLDEYEQDDMISSYLYADYVEYNPENEVLKWEEFEELPKIYYI